MKIVQAINAMIEKKEKITSVIRAEVNENEYFFLYDNKFKWSETKLENDNEYTIFFYPDEKLTLTELAGVDFAQYTNFVRFSTKDIKTTEASESFAELYKILQEKLYNLDDVFDNIING